MGQLILRLKRSIFFFKLFTKMYSLEIRHMSINIYHKLKSLRKTAELINISFSFREIYYSKMEY